MGAKFAYILYNVRGEDHNNVFTYFAQNVIKAVSFAWVQSSCWFIDNDQLWIADQTLCDTKTLAQERSDEISLPCPLPLRRQRDPQMIKKINRGCTGIDAKFLRQIAKHFSYRFLVVQDIDVTQHHRATVGILQCCQCPHQ